MARKDHARHEACESIGERAVENFGGPIPTGCKDPRVNQFIHGDQGHERRS